MDIETIGNTGSVTGQRPASVQPQKVSTGEKKEVSANQTQNQDGKKAGTEKQPSENTVRAAVNNVNVKMLSTRCEFSYHKETRRVCIKVIDKDSDEVIREIPPEKSLEMLQKMWEVAGLFVDERK